LNDARSGGLQHLANDAWNSLLHAKNAVQFQIKITGYSSKTTPV
jgi:hypothetical protein